MPSDVKLYACTQTLVIALSIASIIRCSHYCAGVKQTEIVAWAVGPIGSAEHVVEINIESAKAAMNFIQRL